MIDDSEQASGRDADSGLWLPPRGLLRYQQFKGLGGCLFAATFLLWAVLPWSHRAVSAAAAVLAMITFWVTITSLVRDRRRAHGRQLEVNADGMHLTTPAAATRVHWSDVQSARWRDGHGLCLYGTSGQPLAHIDLGFLADAAEARAFLGWARRHATLSFPVVWD